MAKTKQGATKSPAAKKTTAKKTSTKKPATKTTTKSTTAQKPATGRSTKANQSTKRKPAASKPPANKSTGRELVVQSPARRKLIDAIVAIAATLDDAGLELLLEQARVVDYKGKIEKFNRQLNTAAVKAAQARKAAARPAFSVHVERTPDDFFIIQLDNVRVFFNRSELREITRICHAAANPSGAARRLYAWFSKERSDLLTDVGINTERSPYLANLYQVIVNTYTVKK